MATSQITVGYWNVRGRAGVIRALLGYCGYSFTNKLYTDRDEWFTKDKQNLGFEYPNLPYLIDGDKKLSETLAILNYIALKAGKKELIGDTDEKYIKVQTALGVIGDLRSNVLKIIFSKGDIEAEKKEAFTNGALKAKLEILNKNLEGKEWITGFFSLADFELFEIVDGINNWEPTELQKYPNLVAHHKRFNEIPEYKAFTQTPQFIPK